MKRLLAFLLCVVCCISCFTVSSVAANMAEKIGDYWVLFENEQAKIVKYEGTSVQKLEIPAEFEGYPVTSLAKEVFQNYGFEEVTIPDTVTTIGNRAFFRCTKLEKVNFSGAAQVVENEAFYLSGLKNNPENVDEYGNVYAGNILVEVYEKEGISRVREGTVTAATSALGSHFVNPNSSYGGPFILFEAEPVKELYFPSSLIYVCDYFTSENNTLEKVEFAESKLHIGEGAFEGAYSLASITLPDEIESVEEQAFFMTAYEEDQKNWKNNVLYAGKVLLLCTPSKSQNKITVKDGTTVLAGGAFSYALNGSFSVKLPDTVKWIGSRCFSNSHLTHINLPDTVTEIGWGAFEQCDKLVSLELPSNLKVINNSLLSGSSNVRSVEIPASVECIEGMAFLHVPLIKYQGTKKQWQNIKLVNEGEYDDAYIVYEYQDECTHPEGQNFVTRNATFTKAGRITRMCVYCGKAVELLTVDKKVKVETIFTDVKTSDWFYNSVDYAYNYQAFNGTSAKQFSPNQKMTRGMFVTVLMRLSGNNFSNKVKTQFSDVPTGKYYSGAVRWATQAGIVNGMGKGKFAPDAPITREQLCKMIILYASYSATQVYKGEQAYYFADDAKISKWAWSYVYMCQATGLVKGKNGNLFDPQGNATRAEVATILLNLHQNYMLLK